jgi:hypothetical protein
MVPDVFEDLYQATMDETNGSISAKDAVASMADRKKGPLG